MKLKNWTILFGIMVLVTFLGGGADTASSAISRLNMLKGGARDSSSDAANLIVSDYSDLVAGLVQQIKDEKGGSPDGKLHAIYVLGELRAAAATLPLISLIATEAIYQDMKSKRARWGQYPAAEALVKIGNPVIQPVLNQLAQEPDQKRKDLLCSVIVQVEGKDVAAPARLRAAIAEEKGGTVEKRHWRKVCFFFSEITD